MTYADHIAGKSAVAGFSGIQADDLTPGLFPHQTALVRWALRKGRAAIFADTGLGKTRMQAEWARHVARKGRVLILAPLAVSAQTVREAAGMGIEVVPARSDTGAQIQIANYDILHAFDPGEFTGIVLDESSILKSFTGSTRNAIIDGFRDTPYRLACTATPAPNDFTELGNHSEFLGVLSRVEMLAEYFVHDGGTTQDWRLKGHAVEAFWHWVARWGAMIRSPADLGFDGAAYNLPPLRMIEHVVAADHSGANDQGLLFAAQAQTLNDQRRVRRTTMDARVERAQAIASQDGPCLIWCELNDESRAVTAAIPDAVEVAGSDDAEDKADRLLGFADGKYRVLVTKASIAGFGMNWQRCARMIFMGASHSYEQTYQAIRRCWRFGQTREVEVHVIRSELDGAISQNFKRKDADAKAMADGLGRVVGDAVRAEVLGQRRTMNDYHPTTNMQVPAWLSESP